MNSEPEPLASAEVEAVKSQHQGTSRFCFEFRGRPFEGWFKSAVALGDPPNGYKIVVEVPRVVEINGTVFFSDPQGNQRIGTANTFPFGQYNHIEIHSVVPVHGIKSGERHRPPDRV